jgi:hypothetical protein
LRALTLKSDKKSPAKTWICSLTPMMGDSLLSHDNGIAASEDITMDDFENHGVKAAAEDNQPGTFAGQLVNVAKPVSGC